MKILNAIFYTVFILLLLAISSLFLVSMLPIPGNIEMKIVKSGSMEPTIKTGSLVVVKPAGSYDTGDIITFGEDTKQQIPTTHRIIDVQGDFTSLTYITKGDANEEQDPTPVSEREVIGKVVLSVPYAGYVLDFARQPIGFMLMIGIPAGIIILDELIRIFREVQNLRRKRRGGADSDDEEEDEARYDFARENTFEVNGEIREPEIQRPIRDIDGIRPRAI